MENDGGRRRRDPYDKRGEEGLGDWGAFIAVSPHLQLQLSNKDRLAMVDAATPHLHSHAPLSLLRLLSVSSPPQNNPIID